MSDILGKNCNCYKLFFTRSGVVMLASVLNSPTAIEAGIKVVRAFVKMRSILALHQDLADLMMTDEEREKRYRKARREIEKFIRRNKGLKQSKAK